MRLPPAAEQRAIAHILGTLDDKIELNRRMSETLEAMARATFKDWFVDFGPTRAKAQGRAPYLPTELWNLFPDALDDEGKPFGWEWGNAWGYRGISRPQRQSGRRFGEHTVYRSGAYAAPIDCTLAVGRCGQGQEQQDPILQGGSPVWKAATVFPQGRSCTPEWHLLDRHRCCGLSDAGVASICNCLPVLR